MGGKRSCRLMLSGISREACAKSTAHGAEGNRRGRDHALFNLSSLESIGQIPLASYGRREAMGRRFWPAAWILLALTACGSPTQTNDSTVQSPTSTIYTFEGKTYPSYAEMLAAVDRQSSVQVAAVTPVAKGTGGRALIILPDRDRLRPLILTAAAVALHGRQP